MNVILASQSPRRRELMELLHIPFSVRIADIDETMNPELAPYDEVARLSREKAMAVPRQAEDVVIAADTVVVCGGKVLGKPATKDRAVQMLRLLSGRAHQVMTGLTVLRGEESITGTEVTDVYFRALSEEEIAAYVRTGEPMDKAGAYGIQGGGAIFAEKLVGDYYNVVGLPVCRLWQMLCQIAPELGETATYTHISRRIV